MKRERKETEKIQEVERNEKLEKRNCESLVYETFSKRCLSESIQAVDSEGDDDDDIDL